VASGRGGPGSASSTSSAPNGTRGVGGGEAAQGGARGGGGRVADQERFLIDGLGLIMVPALWRGEETGGLWRREAGLRLQERGDGCQPGFS
jgi:hypothetical protein